GRSAIVRNPATKTLRIELWIEPCSPAPKHPVVTRPARVGRAANDARQSRIRTADASEKCQILALQKVRQLVEAEEVDLPAVVCPRVLLVLKVTIVGGATGRERPLEVRRVDRREARVHAREQRLRLDDQVSELPRLTPEDDAIESRQVAVLEEQRRQRGTLPAARRAAIQDLATVAVEELLLRSRVGAPVLLNRGSRRTPGLCDPLQPPPRYRGQQVRRVPFRNLLA